MLFESVAIVYMTIAIAVVLIFYQRNTQAHIMLIRLYKETAELLGSFRQEMHKAIDSAIHAHVKKYH